ncbi:hypothetical protein K491DRAFT_773944 [Lophiostoma macrostomum CBS 122681]|uniref:Uncharacterized protein n=1 Tax=Lophiostoma macrostomum CBS 122681 TaxID=1314788 RepID=A0A6A6TRQ5_9PLEO|nr:hypothetical protein K491DRAFT_773944 [Lophiostoma macrostomum CBS 122681]
MAGTRSTGGSKTAMAPTDKSKAAKAASSPKTKASQPAKYPARKPASDSVVDEDEATEENDIEDAEDLDDGEGSDAEEDTGDREEAEESEAGTTDDGPGISIGYLTNSMLETLYTTIHLTEALHIFLQEDRNEDTQAQDDARGDLKHAIDGLLKRNRPAFEAQEKEEGRAKRAKKAKEAKEDAQGGKSKTKKRKREEDQGDGGDREDPRLKSICKSGQRLGGSHGRHPSLGRGRKT